MSQRTEILCDRCGKEITNKLGCYNPSYARYRWSAKIQLWAVGETRGNQGQRIDLCEECYEKFVNFLEGGEQNAR